MSRESEIICKCGACGTCKPTVVGIARLSAFASAVTGEVAGSLALGPKLAPLLVSKLGFFSVGLTIIGAGAVAGTVGYCVGDMVARRCVESENSHSDPSRDADRQPIARPDQPQMRVNYGAINVEQPATFGVRGLKLASSSHID